MMGPTASLVDARTLVESRDTHERAWTSCIAMLLVLSAVCVLGLAIDSRTIGADSVWLKPLKFAISTAIHFATLVLCLRLVPDAVRGGWVVRTVVVLATVAVLFEMGWITLQGARAEASHFNLATPFTRTMYSLMGVGAVVLIASAAVVGVLVARCVDVPRPLRHGIALGLIGGFVLTLVVAGTLGGNLSHHVGVHPQGAPTVPFFGWSGVTGDLRPAHFLSLHFMRLVPLAGWGVSRRSSEAVLAVWAFALVLSGLALGLFVQALNGLPVIALN